MEIGGAKYILWCAFLAKTDWWTFLNSIMGNVVFIMNSAIKHDSLKNMLNSYEQIGSTKHLQSINNLKRSVEDLSAIVKNNAALEKMNYIFISKT